MGVVGVATPPEMILKLKKMGVIPLWKVAISADFGGQEKKYSILAASVWQHHKHVWAVLFCYQIWLCDVLNPNFFRLRRYFQRRFHIWKFENVKFSIVFSRLSFNVTKYHCKSPNYSENSLKRGIFYLEKSTPPEVISWVRHCLGTPVFCLNSWFWVEIPCIVLNVL